MDTLDDIDVIFKAKKLPKITEAKVNTVQEQEHQADIVDKISKDKTSLKKKKRKKEK